MSQFCASPGDATYELHANNVNATLSTSGNFLYNYGPSAYRLKTDNGYVPAISTAALWVGGKNANNELRVAGQTFVVGWAIDWYPGPLNDDGEGFENGCIDWNRFWEVDKSEIMSHQLDFEDGEIGFEIKNIYGWPGKNNPHFEANNGFYLPSDIDLAPFFDNDSDGVYNPDKGDYPIIKGDRAVWWVLNDRDGLHRSSLGPPIKMEVHHMVYSFIDSGNENLNNTTFYDFTMINKGSSVLKEAYMGIWSLFGLGSSTDDYVGYSEELQMMYVYNADDCDDYFNSTDCVGTDKLFGDEIPMVGIKKINSMDYPVTSFKLSGNGEMFPEYSNQNSDVELYNNLLGKWRDGTPVTYGGIGLDSMSNDTTLFAFNGEPSDTLAWSFCSIDSDYVEINSLMSSRLPDLQPGESTTASYCIIHVEDVPHPCPSLDKLRSAVVDIVESAVSTSSIDLEINDVSISPNPVIDRLEVSSDAMIASIKIINFEGVLLRDINVRNANSAEINIDDIAAGLYLLCVIDVNGIITSKKVAIGK